MTGPARPTTVGQCGEHALIARLAARLAPPPAWVRLGVGDDAAVVDAGAGRSTVITTDSLVEGVHFRRDWTSPDAIGHKALAVNLSDIAAMGAEPRAALLAMSLPDALPLEEFDGLVGGLLSLAAEARTPLVGGNIARSPGPLVIDVTAVGASPPRKLLTRAGGRPGDALYVTGRLGAAAAGLAIRQAGRPPATPDESACVRSYERPEPRLGIGLAVARAGGAAAAIDLSDGLADAVRQLATASGTGALIEAGAVPVHPGAVPVSPADAGLSLALSGGEDYELLFAVRPRFRRRFLAAARRFAPLGVTRIGQLTRAHDLRIDIGGRLEPLPEGFAHFGPGPGETPRQLRLP